LSERLVATGDHVPEPEAIAVDAVGGCADDALIRGLRESAPEACSELCRRFGPRLHRFAAARLGWDGQSAEDVAIQALADAIRNIRQFNARKSTLTAWLYGVARRQIIRELRRRGRQKSPPGEAQVPFDDLDETTAEADPAGRLVIQLNARRQVSEVAALLTDIEFEVLVLSSVDELSAREIGQVVGRSERAIHSLLHRARTKARERLVHDED
jgi:RNA polymerase sigma-70 factor (ECF subfamily)